MNFGNVSGKVLFKKTKKKIVQNRSIHNSDDSAVVKLFSFGSNERRLVVDAVERSALVLAPCSSKPNPNPKFRAKPLEHRRAQVSADRKVLWISLDYKRSESTRFWF